MSEARLTQLYADAANAKTEENRARRRSAAEAERWRLRYREIVDEITKLNLERKAREREETTRDAEDRSRHREWRHVHRSSKTQWWSILGIARQSNEHEINKAWKRLALKYHPDHGGSVEIMATINAARDEALGR